MTTTNCGDLFRATVPRWPAQAPYESTHGTQTQQPKRREIEGCGNSNAVIERGWRGISWFEIADGITVCIAKESLQEPRVGFA